MRFRAAQNKYLYTPYFYVCFLPDTSANIYRMSHRRGDYVPPKIASPKKTIPTLTRSSGVRRDRPVNQEIDKIPVPEIDARYSITKQQKNKNKTSDNPITLKPRAANTTPKNIMAYSLQVAQLDRVKLDHPAVQWR